MLRKFTVYPKEGKEFTIECDHFEVRDGQFILFNDARQESNEGFLSVAQIAAIMPERQDEKYAIRFEVYLRDKPPIPVFAHAFDLTQGPGVKFSRQEKDMRGAVINEWPLDGIYIALSELVAIVPSDGLRSYRR
jgi:hypothetical protein